MGEFKDTPSKVVIRKTWCKPLLRFINENLNYKLIYLGLPGPQALDLLEWIEYIDQVVAFQCRYYPKPSSIEQDNACVLDLEEKLRTLEREGKLSTYSLYDGWIEEVLLRGRDTNGDSFSQNDVVTVYNLDFCNEITKPLKIQDDDGNIHQFYKSEAIRRLLEIQRDVSSKVRSKKFIMFLTVHSHFWAEEAKNFIDRTESQPIMDYIETVNGLKRSSKCIRLLKAYVFDTVKTYFCNYDFTPEFLPVIYYKGAGRKMKHMLLLFTIIGAENKQVSGAPCFQKTKDYLKYKFITIENGTFCHWENGINGEIDSSLNSIKAFCDTDCFKNVWSK
ncbi:MAG TPA: hypothetical protein VMX17_17265 [Candidatus Glassbacteria bacterium]|nr:hypothetical protein [Candidatus Glassbacteria bacterium]